MNLFITVRRFVGSVLCMWLLAIGVNDAARASEWVKQSNTEALPALQALAKYSPEGAGRYGLDGYDEGVMDLLGGVYERRQADTREVLAQLKQRLAGQQHPKVKQDMQILIQTLSDSVARGELSRRLLIPYFNVPEIVFNGIRAHLQPNAGESKRAAAVVRNHCAKVPNR